MRPIDQMPYRPQMRWGRAGCLGALAIAAGLLGAALLFAGWHTVDSGKVGVTRSFGKVTGTRGAGGFFAQPIGFSMVEYDLRVAKLVEKQQAGLSNQQTLFVNRAAYQYNLTPAAAQQLLQTVGTQDIFEQNVVVPRLESAIKKVTPSYSADQVFPQRAKMEQEMEDILAADLQEYSIEPGSVDITLADVDFDPAYRQAIDAKAKAVQEKQVELANLDKQKTKNEQELQQARTDAERAKIAAQGEANAAREAAAGRAASVRLEAQAEAEANTKIRASVNDQLVQYRYAQNWNGQLPTTMLGQGGGLPLLNLGAGSNGGATTSPAAPTPAPTPPPTSGAAQP